MRKQNSIYLQRLQQQFQNKLKTIINSLKTSSTNDNTVSNDTKITDPDIMKFYYTLSSKTINPNLPSTCFSGAQLQTLYNIPSVPILVQRKVTVAIIIAYHCPTLQSDLNTYWQSPFNFGASSTPPKINVYTFQGATVNSGWNLESCLDVQMVATANPNANIWAVEAKSPNISDLNSAIQYATTTLNADIITMSWGGSDSTTLNGSNSFFINPTNPANFKCFCASSGDTNSVNWPSILSNVISVGGTTLVWNPTATNPVARSEYTWTTAGCGYSTSVAKPQYQNAVNSTAYRATPDISLIANPNSGVSIVYNGQWVEVGGTSVSSPFFAGILSLANQQRFNVGKNPLTSVYTQKPTTNSLPSLSSVPQTNIQTYLYGTMYTNSTLKNTCLTDVIIGTDGNYNANTGYDVATGLGSPNVTAFCNALANNIA
jgi:subtilase family serine protease